MSSVKKQILEISKDLTNLEINTIVKPNISSVKMPDPRHALITIAKEYCFYLKRKVNIQLEEEFEKKNIEPGSLESFIHIRRIARNKLKEYEKNTSDMI